MWQQGRTFTYGLLLLAGFASGGCRADDSGGDTLAEVLARESRQALAAARIGTAGGTLEVLEGELAGVSIVIPEGALECEAVVSIYAAEPFPESTGYDDVGPAAEFRATVAKLLLDATVTVPFTPADITMGTPQQRVLVLRAAGGVTQTVAGADVAVEKAAAPTKTFGTFGAVIDPAWEHNRSIIGGDLRCPRMDNGTTLNGALNGTRLLALAAMTDATILSARSYAANGCGFSPGWEVAWFSTGMGRYEIYSYWATGSSVVDTVLSPPCATPQGYTGKADSTTLSEDFSARWGGTPQTLLVEIRNCNATPAQLPPRVRLTAGTGNYVEYDQAGGFVGQNF